MNYRVFYQKISKPFRPYKKIVFALNQILTLLFYVAYPIVLLLCWKQKILLKAIYFPGISFGLVSAYRHFESKPRPYETWNIRPLIKKKTKGHSMPSRHIFSSAMISMCYVMVSPIVGYFLLFVSAIASCIRVIAGIHYPRDVLVGYVLGVFVGLVMIYM